MRKLLPVVAFVCLMLSGCLDRMADDLIGPTTIRQIGPLDKDFFLIQYTTTEIYAIKSSYCQALLLEKGSFAGKCRYRNVEIVDEFQAGDAYCFVVKGELPEQNKTAYKFVMFPKEDHRICFAELIGTSSRKPISHQVEADGRVVLLQDAEDGGVGIKWILTAREKEFVMDVYRQGESVPFVSETAEQR